MGFVFCRTQERKAHLYFILLWVKQKKTHMCFVYLSSQQKECHVGFLNQKRRIYKTHVEFVILKGNMHETHVAIRENGVCLWWLCREKGVVNLWFIIVSSYNTVFDLATVVFQSSNWSMCLIFMMWVIIFTVQWLRIRSLFEVFSKKSIVFLLFSFNYQLFSLTL